MGKVRIPISQVLHTQWVLKGFRGNQFLRLFPFDGLMLWEIDEKTHAFPI